MPQPMLRFLTSLADAFCADRLDYVAQHASYPLPVYLREELMVFGAANSAVEGLGIYRNAVRNAGVTRIVPRIVAQGLPVRGYSNVWVEWDHYDANGTCRSSSQVRYAVYQDKMALTPKIELVDYTCLAFPEVCKELPVTRTA